MAVPSADSHLWFAFRKRFESSPITCNPRAASRLGDVHTLEFDHPFNLKLVVDLEFSDQRRLPFHCVVEESPVVILHGDLLREEDRLRLVPYLLKLSLGETNEK